MTNEKPAIEQLKDYCERICYINNLTKDMAALKRLIYKVEDSARARMEEVRKFAEEKHVTIQTDEAYNIRLAIKSALGVYMTPSYKSELDRYTCFGKPFELWYHIRDSVPYSWDFLLCKIAGNRLTATTHRQISERGFLGLTPSQVYKNGRIDFLLTEEECEVVKRIKTEWEEIRKRLEGNSNT